MSGQGLYLASGSQLLSADDRMRRSRPSENLMCGEIELFGKKLYIDCELPELPVKWPPDPIDYTCFVDQGRPPTVLWRKELTFLTSVLAGVAVIRDKDMAAALGGLVAEIGSKIAADAGVDVKLTFDSHREA
jgi:hypothetical protein